MVKCRAVGCHHLVPPKLFMCRQHFNLITPQVAKCVKLWIKEDGTMRPAGARYAALAVRIVKGKEGK